MVKKGRRVISNYFFHFLFLLPLLAAFMMQNFQRELLSNFWQNMRQFLFLPLELHLSYKARDQSARAKSARHPSYCCGCQPFVSSLVLVCVLTGNNTVWIWMRTLLMQQGQQFGQKIESESATWCSSIWWDAFYHRSRVNKDLELVWAFNYIYYCLSCILYLKSKTWQ